MHRARPPLLATAVLAALALAACSSGSADGADGADDTGSGSPSASEGPDEGGSGSGGMAMGAPADCPATADLPAPPRRVVTMDAGAAAFLVELGVGDRVVGTAAPRFAEDFTGDLRAAVDAVPVIDQGVGSKESVIAADPDLVTGISVYELGSFDGTPSPEDLAANGIAALIACDVSEGEQTTLDATYAYATNLAATFGVPEAGRELVADLERQVAGAAPDGGSVGAEVPVLSLSAAPTGGTGINTSGGSSMANAIITLAGGRNVAASTSRDFASLSAEQVVAADPQVIVAVSGLSGESEDQLVEAIASSPQLADTTAVRTGNVVVVPQTILFSPSVLNPQAVSTIAAAVREAAAA